LKRFTVSTPPKLLEDFDKTIKQMGYERSHAIRIAMKNFLTEYRWTSEENKVGLGALIMIYDHGKMGLESTLTDIQHNYRNVINSTTHIHLNDQNCLEILAVNGKVYKIQNLAERLIREKRVKQLKLVTLVP
jgi:CopG family nickel-responsive transcriptional regulator